MTPIVVTVNVAALFPGATITEPETLAAALPLVRITVAPAGPAGPESVTVAVEELPPRTLEGLNVKPVRTAGVMVRVAVAVAPASFAEIKAGV